MVPAAQLRCSCNHKPCHKWDAYGYTRHFTFKCHKKYEEERLVDDAERQRLKDAKEVSAIIYLVAVAIEAVLLTSCAHLSSRACSSTSS